MEGFEHLDEEGQTTTTVKSSGERNDVWEDGVAVATNKEGAFPMDDLRQKPSSKARIRRIGFDD